MGALLVADMTTTSPGAPRVLFGTRRLLVRQLCDDDFAPMLAIYGDADAMRWVGDGRPITGEECTQWLAVTANNYRLRGYGMSALVESSSSEVIGFCGLVHPGGQAEPEIKYALARARWGRGLATEAVRGMLAYGERAHGLSRIMATVAPENAASLRVLAKAGMVSDHVRTNDDGSRTAVLVWSSAGR